MSHERAVSVASKIILARGILNLILGIIHVVGAFTFERAKVAGQATAEMRRDYILWFYGVGIFIIFMGLLDILCYPGLKGAVLSVWRISVLCSVFTTILGLSGVMVFGISPPLQLLVTGVAGLAALGVSGGTREANHAR